MKNTIFVKATFLFCTLVIFSCGTKKEDSTGGEEITSSNEWKEMDEFHMVMAETFHPYKDSADLAPVKAKAMDLVAAADKWSNAALPEKVKNDEMKTKLQELKSETESLADVVQTGEDAAIGEHLTKVHDLFHTIQEEWYGGSGHEHVHEH
jgi:hypothetical protein